MIDQQISFKDPNRPVYIKTAHLYKKGKTMVEITKIMNISISTVTRLRDKAQGKIVEKILKGE